MGCSPSNTIRNGRLSGHNSILPDSHLGHPTSMRSDWTSSHFFGSYSSAPQPSGTCPTPFQPSEEPPPYTEHPENGHITLLRSPSKMNDCPCTTSAVDNSTASYQLSFMETEQEQYSGADTSEMDILSQSLDTFRPVSTSSPIYSSSPFPERPRRSRSSDSVINSSPRQIFPPRPTLEPVQSRPTTRRVILPTVTTTSVLNRTLPSRLPPLQYQFSAPVEQSEEYIEMHPSSQYQSPLQREESGDGLPVENTGSPPVEYADRPPVEYLDRPPEEYAERPPEEYSDRSVVEYAERSPGENLDRPPVEYSDRPSAEYSDRPPMDYSTVEDCLQHQQWQHSHDQTDYLVQTSQSGAPPPLVPIFYSNNQRRQSDGGHSGKRKRRRRKRLQTWHGERVAPAAHDHQDAVSAAT